MYKQQPPEDDENTDQTWLEECNKDITEQIALLKQEVDTYNKEMDISKVSCGCQVLTYNVRSQIKGLYLYILYNYLIIHVFYELVYKYYVYCVLSVQVISVFYVLVIYLK